MRSTPEILLAFLLSIWVAMPAIAAPAPRLTIQSFESLPQPLPAPYGDAGPADIDRRLAKARTRARTTGKRLLIDLGGNWCPDCRVLAGVMEHPQMQVFMRRNFEIVMVDIGRYNRNMHVPAKYGISRLSGVPSILVIDPKTDILINKTDIVTLANARAMSPQGVADWLAQWTK